MDFSKFANHHSGKESRRSLMKDFDEFIVDSFSKDIWAGELYTNERIYWRDFNSFKKRCSALNDPGLYIWGSGKKILKEQFPKLIYVGKTEGSLLKRLNKRYIGDNKAKKTQCRIANSLTQKGCYSATLEDIIQEFFPDRIGNQKEINGISYRYTGAMRFQKDGIDDIWVIVIPIQDKSKIGPLESCLISIANEWNLNKQNCSILSNSLYLKDISIYITKVGKRTFIKAQGQLAT